MTEQPATYATPAKDELTFRLVTPGGLSIGVSFPPGPEADDLSAATRALVMNAFERGAMGQRFPEAVYGNHQHEVLAQCTLDHIAALERILNDCCNAMIDAPTGAVADEDHWLTLIDRARAVLGVGP